MGDGQFQWERYGLWRAFHVMIVSHIHHAPFLVACEEEEFTHCPVRFMTSFRFSYIERRATLICMRTTNNLFATVIPVPWWRLTLFRSHARRKPRLHFVVRSESTSSVMQCMSAYRIFGFPCHWNFTSFAKLQVWYKGVMRRGFICQLCKDFC